MTYSVHFQSIVEWDVPYNSGGITGVSVRAAVDIQVSLDLSYIFNVDLLSAQIYFGSRAYDYPASRYDLPRILQLAESGQGLNRYLNSVRQSRKPRGGRTVGRTDSVVDLVGGAVGRISGR